MTARRKKADPRSRKVLSRGRVERTLEALEVPLERFYEEFEATKGARSPKRITPEQERAVKRFLEDGDFQQLQDILDLNSQTASTLVRRYLQKQAREK